LVLLGRPVRGAVVSSAEQSVDARPLPRSLPDHGARPQAAREVGGARAHHPHRQL